MENIEETVVQSEPPVDNGLDVRPTLSLVEAAQTFGSDPDPVEPISPRQEEGYVSMSSVDSPPKGMSADEKRKEKEDEKAAEEQFRKPRESDLYAGERLFEIDFAATLKPAGGKPIKVPLFVDDGIRGTIVEESLELALSDRRNVQIIQAILDNPKDRVRAGEAHPDAARIAEQDTKQTALF